MTRFERTLRALSIAWLTMTLGVGCQAVFGDFHINDRAFGGASGSGAGTTGMAGTSGVGGSGEMQTGPIRVMPTVGLFTTEWGSQATFSIVLIQQPTAPVTIGLSSSNTAEGNVSPASVTFTTANWRAPQTVTVTGVDDTLPDFNQKYTIVSAPATSDDPAFSGQDAVDVTLTNIDNETAGVTIVPTAGLVTSESGGQDTFTVVLNSKPQNDVSIDLNSSKPAEGTVSPSHLVFTPSNWMAPQLITVSGIDDPDKDGPQSYVIASAPSVSDDPSYSGVDGADVQVTNQDNESAGVTVTLVNGIDPVDRTKLRTSESGDAATFTVQLNAPPSADVVIPISSGLDSEAQVSPVKLTFTEVNWNAPQTVTVTGVNDDVADGNQPYAVVLGAALSDDLDYQGLDADDVSASNVDNDTPGFTLMLISGIDPKNSNQLLTTEAGTTATFSLALNSKPRSDVKISLSSGLPSEGVVTPTSLTFTPVNWMAPQIVSVKGQDDAVQDGNPLFFVRTATAVSDDGGYLLDPPDVQVTNEDNDSAGVRVTLGNGIDPSNANRLVTGENGDSATFTVALTSRPVADVTIAISSGNTQEGTVSPPSLTFTKSNYGAPQTVTVVGVDDTSADGNQLFAIALAAAKSPGDLNFNGKFASQVQVTNRDNDTAGIIVTPTTGLVTSENGRTASFTLQLQSKPMADVSIGISSSNTAEGTVNLSKVTFTSANWNAPQTVTITGQNDDVADGNAAYKIVTATATSLDLSYGPNKLDPPDVNVTNLDNDSAGIIVTPTSGLSTTEDGGTATFTIALQSKPTAPVTLKLSSSRPLEGTVSPTSLAFTQANWNSPQVVTVKGADDSSADGPQPYLIVASPTSSADGNYNNRQASDVSVTNIDNDSAGIRIGQVIVPGVTTEKLGTSTFTVVLNSLPGANVTFALSSTNPLEGSVAPASLVFTPANWNAPRTVTVTGVDDQVADNDQPYKIHIANAVSTDPGYSGLFTVDVPFINLDDDRAGYLVNAAPNLQTKENGAPVTFTVALLSKPTASVTVPLSSSNPLEGTVLPASLSFTTANWATPQTVTVSGADDSFADGPQPYAVNLANAVSMDAKYSGMFGTQVGVTNLDDDQPGFTVVASNLQTTEKGGQATFTVVLLSQPHNPEGATSTVKLALSSSDTDEGRVAPASLLFDATNWSVPQTVTVTGVDDSIADGNQTYLVQFAAAVSNDSGYSGKSPAAISLTNVDDDMAGVLVTPTTCSTTPGTTATFTLVLTSQPTADVSIDLSSDTPTEGAVSATRVTFTVDDWNVEQSVTVTGVDDGSMGAVTNYVIVTGNTESPGEKTGYDNAPVADVSCTNTVMTP